MRWIAIIFLALFLFGCTKTELKETDLTGTKVATFAGGCFWCIEAAFEPVEGVVEAISGYTGGTEENPTYREVASGTTSHHEAVQVYYDPKKITYKELVEHFWKQIDPTDDGGQFVDRGSQYKTAIFYHDEEQKKIVQESIAKLEASGKFNDPIKTQILPFTKFYEAEEYHQDYYKKSAVSYKIYEKGSGRETYKNEVWKTE